VAALLLSTTFLSVPPLAAFAAAVPSTDSVPTLNQVTVTGQVEAPLTGSNTLDREQLDHLPAKNGSINEAISVLPGVQLPESGRLSTRGGELLPPNLSISGGTVYQNRMLIDGFSNDSLLDPMNDDPTSMSQVPGHPQAIFLPTSLAEEITIYRYNVPVEFGGFTGGVVDASIKTPAEEFSGEISYRTTRDSWTNFHIDDQARDAFDQSNSTTYQPRFEKQEAGVNISLPLRDDLRLLTAYSLQSSTIPLHHVGETKEQRRKNETFLAKLVWDVDSRATLTALAHYSPYSGDYFYRYAKDGDFTIEGGGWQAGLTYERDLDWARLTARAAIKGSRNDRDAPQNLYQWLAEVDGSPSSKFWGPQAGSGLKSYEGSVGSMEREQASLEFASDLLFTPLQLGDFQHQLKTGVQLETVRGTLDREQSQGLYLWKTGNANPDIVCAAGDPACIDGEQAFLARFYWQQASASADVSLLNLYLEDTITWQRLEVRPGVRLSYDDFMENSNIAPRLSATLDLFGNGRTLLTGGYNRYYGKTLLSYKLREATPSGSDYQVRPLDCVTDGSGNTVCTPGDWPTYDPPSSLYRFSETKTPYTDERVFGIDQLFVGGRLKLTRVERDGRNEFAREKTEREVDGHRYYQLTNNGSSYHEEYTLEWQRSWQNQYLAVNATFQTSTRSNESYKDDFYDDDLTDRVSYEGELINYYELPRKDFNRPWIVNLTYSVSLPKGLTFTNVTRYRSGYKGIDFEKYDDGVMFYKKAEFPQAWTFDWVFNWEIPVKETQSLTASLEINNVFNNRVQVGDGRTVSDTAPEDYELGRQYWLGLVYRF
jgi:hypothetical protein